MSNEGQKENVFVPPAYAMHDNFSALMRKHGTLGGIISSLVDIIEEQGKQIEALAHAHANAVHALNARLAELERFLPVIQEQNAGRVAPMGSLETVLNMTEEQRAAAIEETGVDKTDALMPLIVAAGPESHPDERMNTGVSDVEKIL